MTKKTKSTTDNRLKIGIVVPHIFMQDELLSDVIFSPGTLALQLCEGLQNIGHEVTLYTPGKLSTSVTNVVSDSTLFDRELALRGDSYIDLLRKHPFTFVTLARQLQSEITAKAYQDANDGLLDIVHIYTNEEELALSFAGLCKKPVVFTHHDPFNFLIKYKNNFPKYAHLNWISISRAQRLSMPTNTRWISNIYHGFDDADFQPVKTPTDDYILFLGRIIEPKGLHLAIRAVQSYNRLNPTKVISLKIAGKHYGDESNDSYWKETIEPSLKDPKIEYRGYVNNSSQKADLLANARSLIMPSLFDEPFGMVAIESLACGTPVIGLDSGAISEVVLHKNTGFITKKIYTIDGELDEVKTIDNLMKSITEISSISRTACRAEYLDRFTAGRMCIDYSDAYAQIIESQDQF